MQERQEFLDRYFVFTDSTEYEPPSDWSRTNGLVEDIRQSYFELDERKRLEEMTQPEGVDGRTSRSSRSSCRAAGPAAAPRRRRAGAPATGALRRPHARDRGAGTPAAARRRPTPPRRHVAPHTARPRSTLQPRSRRRRRDVERDGVD